MKTEKQGETEEINPRQKKKRDSVIAEGEILEAGLFPGVCALSACCIMQTVPDMLLVPQPPAQ